MALELGVASDVVIADLRSMSRLVSLLLFVSNPSGELLTVLLNAVGAVKGWSGLGEEFGETSVPVRGEVIASVVCSLPAVIRCASSMARSVLVSRPGVAVTLGGG